MKNASLRKVMDSSTANIAWQRSLRRQALWAAVSLALSMPMVQAQTVPDGHTHTGVVAAPNGVPVVDIAAPNRAGVSDNTYNQFNVDKNGLIFNNSSKISNTQLAGYIGGNPNLGANQSASLIINEVTSTAPSQLNGAMEVAGHAAQVVVANPNGISCNGCGFINAPRGTLTTGKPLFGSDGSLSGFAVTQGTIAVNGSGLSAGSTDQVDLLARAVAINAGVWARQLNVVTGANRINFSNLTTQPLSATGATPSVALDVSALGGMYANAIFLVGTEAGLGVNNQGNIIAQNGDLTITNAGEVELAGKTTATGNVAITTAQALVNQGTLAAGGTVNLDSGNFTNAGVLYGNGAITVSATGTVSNSGQIEAQNGALSVDAHGAITGSSGSSVYAGGPTSLSGASFDNAGKLESAQGFTLQVSSDAANSGSLSVDAGNFGLNAATIENTGSLLVGGNASLNAGTHLVSSGALVANGAVTLAAPDLSTAGTVQAGSTLGISGGALTNAGNLYALGGDWTASLSGAFDNQNGGVIYGSRNVALTSAALTNAGGIEAQQGDAITVAGALINSGTLQSDQTDVTLQAGSLANSGTVSAKRNLQLQTRGAAENSGVLVSGQAFDLASDTFDNQTTGQIQSGTDAGLTGVTLGNAGTIDAKGNATLKAGNDINSTGTLVAGGALGMTAPQLVTASTIEAGGALSLNGGTLRNAGKLYAQGGNWVATLSGAFSNQAGGDIYSSQGLTLDAASLDSSGGIEARQTVDITVGAAFGNSGTLQSDQSGITLSASSLANTGTLSANQNLQWQVAQAAQNSGVLVSGQAMSLSSGRFDNQVGGQIQSGTDLALSAAALDNAGTVNAKNNAALSGITLDIAGTGQLLANGALTLGETGDVSNAGVVQAGSDLTMTHASSLANAASGTLYAGQNFNIGLSQALTNAGILYATRTGTLSAGSVTNTGTLRSGGSLSLASTGDVTSSGAIQAQQSVDLTGGAGVTNGGKLYAIDGSLTVQAAGAFSSLFGGDIFSGHSIGVQAGSFANAGTFEAAQGVNVLAQGSADNSGDLQADHGDLVMSGSALSNRGTLSAAGATQLTSAGSLGNSGKLVTGQTLALTAASFANGGQIQSGGNATLQAASVVNGGLLQAGGSLGIVHNTSLTNQSSGSLLAAENVSADTASLLTNDGVVQAGSNLAIDGVGAISNAAGATLYATQFVTLQLGGGLDNAGAVFGAQGVNLATASLDNSGTVRSGAALDIATQGDAVNSGTAYALGLAEWHVGGALVNGGVLAAADNVTVQAASLAGNGTLAAGLQDDGSLGTAGNLAVTTTGNLAAGGRSLAAGNLEFAGSAIDLSGSQTRASNITLAASHGNVTNAGGDLAANGTVAITTRANLVNGGATATQGGKISAGTLALQAGALDNRHGSLIQTGASDLNIALAGNFANANGILATNAHNLGISAAAIDNTAGTLQDAGNGTLDIATSGDLTNTGGKVAGNGALALQAGGTLGNAGGLLSVAGDVAATVARFDNMGGTLIGQNVDISAAQAVTNTSGGTIQAGGALQLDAGSLDNTAGYIKVTDAQSLNLATSGALTNGAGGFIGGNGAATVHAGSLVNAGQIYAGGTLGVTSQGQLSNDGGALQAQASASIVSGGALSNHSGRIEAGSGDSTASLSVKAASLDNTGGRVADAGLGASTFTVAQGAINAGGTLGGQGAVTLSAASLDNRQAGKLVAGQSLALALGSLANTGGDVYAAGDLGWNNANASLDNAQGSLQAGGNLSLDLASLDNTGGTIATNQDGSLSLGSFTGLGKIAAGQDLSLTLGGNYTNVAGSELSANRNFTLNVAGDFGNASGATLQAVNQLTVNAANIDNAAGATLNSADTVLTANGALSNAGSIEGNAITLNAGSLTNTANIIGGNLTITAGSLTNGADLGTDTGNNPYQSALIAGADDVNLYVSGTLLNRDATIFSLGNLSIGADANGGRSQAVTNLSGDIEADRNITLNANQFTNQRRVVNTATHVLTAAEQTGNTSTTTSTFDWTTDPNAVAWCAHYATTTGANGHPVRCGPMGYYGDSGHETLTEQVQSVNRLVSASAQSKLVGGGDITVNGSVLNNASVIAAGNNLIVNGQNGNNGGGSAADATVQNIAWVPTAQVQTNDQRAVDGDYLGDRWYSNRENGGAPMIYWTGTSTSTIALDSSGHNGWITIAPGAGLAATMSAGNTVSITAHTIDNTTVGANGQPVQTAIGLGNNAAGSQVSGADAGAVGQASGTDGSVGGVAVGNAPGQTSTGSLGLATARSVDGTPAQGSTSSQNLAPNGSSAPTQTTSGGSAASAAPQVVATLVGPHASTQLPQTGLYTVNVQPGSQFLFETNPQFTQYDNFISSDYLLQQLGLNPQQTEQRLGDGFYEQQLVLDQITDLTGRRYLTDDTDALDQYRQLMSNASDVAKQFNLSVGVALTPAQMADLTQDIVWLVSVNVDGHQVLEPVVYLSAADAKRLAASGATIAGKNVILTASGDLSNNGTISASNDAQLAASNLLNSGTISAGNDLSLTAAQDILNGGTLHAGGNVSLVAGNDVLSGVDVAQSLGTVNLGGLSTSFSPVALSNLSLPGAISAGGNLAISAGRDLSLDQAPVSAGANLSLAAGRDLTSTASAISAGGDAQLLAGRDLNLDAITQMGGISDASQSTVNTIHTVSSIASGGSLLLAAGHDLTSQGAQLNAGNQLALSAGHDVTLNAVTDNTFTGSGQESGNTFVTQTQSDDTVRGTSLNGTQGVTVTAGHDLTAIAGNIASQNGDVTLAAGHDVNLAAAQEDHSTTQDTYSHKDGFLSSSTRTTHSATNESDAIGTTVSGDAVSVAAGHDLTGTAVQIAGTHDVTLAAGNDLTLNAGKDTYTENDSTQTTHTGLMSGGGFSVLIGERSTQVGTTVNDVSYTGSLVGSTGGAVTLTAGHDVHITGSDVLSKTATTIVGQNVTIDAAVGSTDTTQTQSMHASGIHVGLSGAAVSAVQAAAGASRGATRSQDGRVKALYALQAAYAADQAVQTAKAAASSNGGGINLQVGITASSAHSELQTHDDVTYGSAIHSNGNVAIAATNGDLNVIGSQVNGHDVTLAASHDLNLLSQAEQHTEKSSSSNESAGIGVSFGTNGFNVYVQAAMGEGKGHGNGVTHTDTVVNAADTLRLVAGNDATIQGAQAMGNTVQASIGHSLNIASEQDTNDYASKQWQAGGMVMFGMGGGGSFSYSQNNTNNHYASVAQTSGISAGNGGFDIHVGGNTDLKGAVIASTAGSSRNYLSTQTLTHEDIANAASADASGYGVALSYSGQAKGEQKINMSGTGAQVPISMDRNGTTQSAIAQGTLDIRSGAPSDISRDPNWTGGQVSAYSQQHLADKQALANAFVGIAGMVANAVYSAREANYDGQIQQKLNQARDAESAGDMTAGQTLRWDAFNLQQQRDNPALSPVMVGAGTALAGSLLGGSLNLGYFAQSTSLDYIGNAWTTAGKGFNQKLAVKVTCAPAESACQGGKGGFALDTHASLADQLKQLQKNGYTLTLLDAISGPSGDGPGTILATNGILNTLPRAAQVMLGNVATSAGQPNTTYYLQYNQTYGLVSDLFQAGWDKFVAPMYGEYSATTNALANAISQYPNSTTIGDVGLYGHSWGSITTRNVEDILANSGYKNTGMSVAVFGPAVSPESIVEPLEKITNKPVGGKNGLALLTQVSYFSKYDDPVATFVGGTLFSSPYFDPNSGVYLQGASQGRVWQALQGLGPVLSGSINPHSCYNLNCLGTPQNWTAENALNYSLKHQSQEPQMQPTVPSPPPISTEASKISGGSP